MNIKRLTCNPLQENCYVVSDDTKECIIIDCGAFYQQEEDALRHYILCNQLKPVHLLATHGHLDHNFGNSMLYEDFGLKVEICAEDQYLIEDLAGQAANMFGMELHGHQAPVGRWLKEGDTVSFGAHTVKVIQTPGHTPGGAVFYCETEHTAFTGDTLFRMSVGRTDFEGGSWAQLEHSLRTKVATLPKETIILSGHGPQSTICDELSYNPYISR